MVRNASASLQTTSAAEANLAEGQFSFEEQTLNNDNKTGSYFNEKVAATA
jgi:hypothetical protein